MSLNKFIVITGGICSGKSFITDIIKDRGYKIYNTDEIAKDIINEKNEIFYEILSRYGKNILDSKGYLNKTKLAKIILTDEEERNFIESLIHPKVIEFIKKDAEKYNTVFIETALAKRSGICNMGKVWYVKAPKEVRIERMLGERGYSEESVQLLFKSQEDEETLMLASDEVIENDFGQDIKKRVIELIEKYENMQFVKR